MCSILRCTQAGAMLAVRRISSAASLECDDGGRFGITFHLSQGDCLDQGSSIAMANCLFNTGHPQAQSNNTFVGV